MFRVLHIVSLELIDIRHFFLLQYVINIDEVLDVCSSIGVCVFLLDVVPTNLNNFAAAGLQVLSQAGLEDKKLPHSRATCCNSGTVRDLITVPSDIMTEHNLMIYAMHARRSDLHARLTETRSTTDDREMATNVT